MHTYPFDAATTAVCNTSTLADAPSILDEFTPPSPAGSVISARPTEGPAAGDGADPARVWTREECEALFKRIVGMTAGGGDTSMTVRVSSGEYLRWARNKPKRAEITRNTRVVIRRVVGNASVSGGTNKLDDASLRQFIGELEQRLQTADPEQLVLLPGAQEYPRPKLWSDTTFGVTVPTLSEAARAGVQPVRTADMVAAGFAGTRAETWAIFSTRGVAAYATGTLGMYSQTVRSPDGTGAGHDGQGHTDWAKLDVAGHAAQSLRACTESVRPRAIEPGRYTAILKPRVVACLVMFMVDSLGRNEAEDQQTPFSDPNSPSKTKIGQKVLDERITISTDPADPDTPYMPFNGEGYAYRPVTWIERGVLKALAYNQYYARQKMHTDVPLLNPDAFRMSGGETSLEEMIATTERGLLVSELGPSTRLDQKSGLVGTATQNGLWLIEKGKIKFPVKNMRVVESPFFICNSVEQLGKTEVVYASPWEGLWGEISPPAALGYVPTVAPIMKVRDFNFAAMTGAV